MSRFPFRKTIAIMACAGLGAASFAAGPPKQPVTAPGKLPVVEKPVTITGFVPSIGFVKDWATNLSSIYLEGKTGLHFDWITATKEDAKTKLSVLISSGDYPEVIMGGNIALSQEQIQKYGKQGIFLRLNDLIDKQGYWTKELFKASPEAKEAVSADDGSIYSLPMVQSDDTHMIFHQKMWINKKWLDKLGLKVPTTTDEFAKAMLAFKTMDPNGNGKADEIPLTGAKRYLEDSAMWLMNGFIPAGGDDGSGDATLNAYEFIVGNKVFFNADKPEFREGLRYLRKLYKDGLFDPAALTQDRNAIKPLIDGESNRVGAFASHHPQNASTATGSDKDHYLDFVILPPLKGPQGKQYIPSFYDFTISAGNFIITDKCKNPEAAFRYADFRYDTEASNVIRAGGLGASWAYVGKDEKATGLDGKPALYKYLPVVDNSFENIGNMWTRDIKMHYAVDKSGAYEKMLYDATQLYKPFGVPRYPYGSVSIPEASMTEMADLRRTLHSYIGESVDRFIIGDLDLDKDWDGYLKQLKTIGADRYLQILSSAYNKK
jgi:ABC-type sugar transport system, periplasmic component